MHQVSEYFNQGSKDLQKNQEAAYGQEAIAHSLHTKWIGKEIYFYEETDSTNMQAQIKAEQGVNNGTLFVADKQTAGRGRRGRTWESPGGSNLYFTLLLKPSFAPDKASMLTLVMAMAVVRGMEKQLGRCGKYKGNLLPDHEQMLEENRPLFDKGMPGIKWPNDIVADGKKLCGILTEMSLKGSLIESVAIGVGINVYQQAFVPEVVPNATNIEEAYGQRLSRTALLADILEAFEEEYEVFEQQLSLVGLKEQYNIRLVNLNREVKVLDPKGEYEGVARGITDTGELLVELTDGSMTEVYAGEVSVRGVYGYV